MNNLICVFFGHREDNLMFREGQDELFIVNNGVRIANFRLCKRCTQVFIETIPMSGKK